MIYSSLILKRHALLAASVLVGLACGSDKTVTPPVTNNEPGNLGIVGERFTGEVYVRGSTAYTTTWGSRDAVGNAVLNRLE